MNQSLFKDTPTSIVTAAIQNIDYQAPWNDLDPIVADIRIDVLDKKINNKLLTKKYGKLISKRIFARTGILTEIIFAPVVAANIVPLYLNKNHVLANPGYAWMTKIQNINLPGQESQIAKMRDYKKKGSIHPGDARVSGVYSKYAHTLQLDVFSMISFHLTDREMSAIITHEVGHAYTFIHDASSLLKTQSSLDSVLRTARRATDKGYKAKSFEPSFKELGSEGVLTKEDISELRNTDKGIILGYTLGKLLLKNERSNTLYNARDTVSGETMADMFANRLGYGTELVTGLMKLNKGMGVQDLHYETTLMIKITRVTSIAYIVAALILTYLPITPLPLVALGAFLVSIFINILIGGTTHEGDYYPGTKERLTLIKQDMINRLPLIQDHDASETKMLIENIGVIKSILANIPEDKPPMLMDKISNYIYTSNEDQRNGKELFTSLNELVSNDLHYTASILGSLSNKDII